MSLEMPCIWLYAIRCTFSTRGFEMDSYLSPARFFHKPDSMPEVAIMFAMFILSQPNLLLWHIALAQRDIYRCLEYGPSNLSEQPYKARHNSFIITGVATEPQRYADNVTS